MRPPNAFRNSVFEASKLVSPVNEALLPPSRKKCENDQGVFFCDRFYAISSGHIAVAIYLGVHNHYSQLSYFGELFRVTGTVTVIIFPVINHITVMSPLQL